MTEQRSIVFNNTPAKPLNQLLESRKMLFMFQSSCIKSIPQRLIMAGGTPPGGLILAYSYCFTDTQQRNRARGRHIQITSG